MIKKNIEITINSKTRQVNFEDNFLGINGENLQGYLIFKFEDNFVNGVPVLKVEQDDKTYNIYEVIKENETYKMLIKSSLLKSDIVYIVLTITESGTKDGIPKFISKKFHMYVGDTIETTKTIPDEYDSWIDTANEKINEINEALTQVDNLDINATKEDNKTTIEVTKKDGSTQNVKIYDGLKGDKGDPNTLTIGEVVRGDEAYATITGESPNQVLNLTLPKGDKGDKGIQGEQGIQGPIGPIGPKGDRGERGLQGIQGPTGPRGLQGPRGEKGDKGDRGDQGPQGDIGPQGPQGPAGETPDLTNYYTKDEIDLNFYTKVEIDSMIGDIEIVLNEVV